MGKANARTTSAEGQFMLLFSYMMVQLAILPVFEGSEVLGAAGDLVFFVLIFYVVYSIRNDSVFWISVAFFVLTLGCYGLAVLYPRSPHVFLLMNLSVAGFIVSAIYSMVTFILRMRRISLGAVLGGLCVYLLIGALFTAAYITIELLVPGSFDFGVHRSHESIVALYDLLYFYSFVSLLTIGYGDIIPLSHSAQTLSVLEGVVGQFYMAFYVAMLVGMYIYGRLADDPESGG